MVWGAPNGRCSLSGDAAPREKIWREKILRKKFWRKLPERELQRKKFSERIRIHMHKDARFFTNCAVVYIYMKGLHMGRNVSIDTRINRMKRSVEKGDIEEFLSEMIVLGLESNEPEDFKMSPRTMYELAELLFKMKKMNVEGRLTEKTNWFDVVGNDRAAK